MRREVAALEKEGKKLYKNKGDILLLKLEKEKRIFIRHLVLAKVKGRKNQLTKCRQT